LATELEIEGTGGFEFSTAMSDSSSAVTQFAYTGNLKLYPLHGRVQPWAKVGLGGQTATVNIAGQEGTASSGDSETETGFTLRFGAGADFYLDEDFYLFIEGGYVMPVSSAIDGLDYATVGAGIGFAF